MIDALIAVHVSSTLLVLLVTGLMSAGFVRLAWRARGLIGHLAMAVLTVHVAVFIRTLHRDLLTYAAGYEAAYSRFGLLTFAVVTNALIILAGWHGLKAIYLAIPEEQRPRYSLLTAALYPPFRRK